MYQTDEETEKQRIETDRQKDSKSVRFGIIGFSVGMTLIIIIYQYLKQH